MAAAAAGAVADNAPSARGPGGPGAGESAPGIGGILAAAGGARNPEFDFADRGLVRDGIVLIRPADRGDAVLVARGWKHVADHDRFRIEVDGHRRDAGGEIGLRVGGDVNGP